MLSTTIKAKFPWFYRYLLRQQLRELESAWEELLAKHQTPNQKQCPEYQSKACLHAKCLKYFLFLNSSRIFFNKRYFGRHLPFRYWISGLVNALIMYNILKRELYKYMKAKVYLKCLLSQWFNILPCQANYEL